jgi:hypothetical protein
MGRTERAVFVASSIAFVVASSIATVVALTVVSAANPVGPSPAIERPSTLVSASPAVFAEHVTSAHQRTSGRNLASLRSTLELIVLVVMCAVGVALYSAASDRRGTPDTPPPSRRR